MVRATDSIDGATLEELRKRYYAVGVGEKITEIPFADLIIILSMIEQQVAGLKALKTKPTKDFRISYKINTGFTDADAARLLNSIKIETPFDKGKFVRVEASRVPTDVPHVAE